MGAKVDYQAAAPAETRTPNLHRAKIAQKECGWKDGDRGGSAQTQKPPTGRKKKNRQKKKNQLDTHRPSHGRTWHTRARWFGQSTRGSLLRSGNFLLQLFKPVQHDVDLCH